MLQTAYLKPSTYVLYYEVLDISIVKLVTKKFFKVAWLGNMVKEKVYHLFILNFINLHTHKRILI
jgi:hypothetical protein